MLVADVNLELLDKKGRHMPQIVWDDVGQKAYESGLDRGVLYFTDGTVLPWNGLISVEENHGRTKENIYYDGVKIGESQTREPFSATVTAYTYPWVLEYITGDYAPRRGITAGEQVSLPVAFSYRTKIGNDLGGDVGGGYKIHVIFSGVFSPVDRTYETQADSLEPVEIAWELTTYPTPVSDFYSDGSGSPITYMTIITDEVDPGLLIEIERRLYGDETYTPTIETVLGLPMLMQNWAYMKITDNGDGTWTASSDYEGYIFLLPNDEFRLEKANAVYETDFQYRISDTQDLSSIVAISISDNGNGTWTASTDHAELITVNSTTGTFTILNANVTTLTPDSYSLSDTTE